MKNFNLDKPSFSAKEIPENTEDEYYINKEITLDNNTFKISSVVIGANHTVLFVEDFNDMDFERIGKK